MAGSNIITVFRARNGHSARIVLHNNSGAKPGCNTRFIGSIMTHLRGTGLPPCLIISYSRKGDGGSCAHRPVITRRLTGHVTLNRHTVINIVVRDGVIRNHRSCSPGACICNGSVASTYVALRSARGVYRRLTGTIQRHEGWEKIWDLRFVITDWGLTGRGLGTLGCGLWALGWFYII